MARLDLNEAIALLEAYLNDEIIIDGGIKSTERKPRRKKRKKSKGAPQKIKASKLTELDILLASIDLLGRRVMKKYMKGETPHPERLSLMVSALSIKKGLIRSDALKNPSKITLRQNGYIFKCLRWQHEILGEILIPLPPPSVDANFNGEKQPIQMKSIDGLNKATARLRILDYCREQGI